MKILRGRNQGRFFNIAVGSAIGVVSGYSLFHQIFGERGEKLVDVNKKLHAEREISEKAQQQGK